MAKVLPINGMPSAELMGAALGKAQAMEKRIIAFQEKLRIDGGTVIFRRAPGGVVTAFVSGGVFAAAYTGVMYPETVDKELNYSFPYGDSARLKNGVFPKTEFYASLGDYGTLVYRTVFGVSPYSNKFIRRGQYCSSTDSRQNVTQPDAKPTVNFYPFFNATGEISREHMFTTYVINQGDAIHTGYRDSDIVPCISAGDRALIATREYQTKITIVDGSTTFPNPLAYSQPRTSGIQETTGTSWIRLRMTSTVDGAEKYRYVDVAELPIKYTDYTLRDLSLYSYLTIDELQLTRTNDLNPSLAPRSWHSMEFVTISPNGSAFVLRETNQTHSYLHTEQGFKFDSRVHDYDGSVPTNQYTESATRGLTLSFVAPDDTVTEAVYTRDIGEFGYLVNVIPSSDSKKVYVYYGLHDDSAEPKKTYFPPRQFFPTKYTEYLDVFKITKKVIDGVKTYSFEKTSTIDLGAVTLIVIGSGTAANYPIGTTHYASKLLGAALEVNGYIWADRYCYDVKNNSFLQLPDFQDFRSKPSQEQQAITRNAITSSDNWLTSFLAVNKSGREASYYWLSVYTSSYYKLAKNELGEPIVKLIKRMDVPGDFKQFPLTQWDQRYYRFDIENPAAQTVLFSKPAA